MNTLQTLGGTVSRRAGRWALTSLLAIATAAGCDDRSGTVPSAPSTRGDGGAAGTPVAGAPVAGTSEVFNLLEKTYAPLLPADDPLGFPMKVRNLADSPYRFWRGAKEPFYQWCRARAADWLADPEAFLVVHGDLHPANFGLYHAKGKFGRRVAFGAVDFDDSARLPFQFELLQGAVTFRLLARHRSIKLDDRQFDELLTVMLAAYRAALDSEQTPTELLDDDRWVSRLVKDVKKRDYADEFKKYVEKDAFVRTVTDKSGRAKEVLKPARGKSVVADAIEAALLNSPDGRDLFKGADVKKKAVEDIAQRTQLSAAGSAGLRKYLVLLDNKRSPEGQVILYLKQQVPSSAERVGLVPTDPRPPGRRVSEDMDAVCDPPVYFNSWCAMDGASFHLGIVAPWSESLDAAEVDTFLDLKHMGKIWGTVAGSLHRRQGKAGVIKARLTPELSAALRERSQEYARKVSDDFAAFTADPRVRQHIAAANDAVRALTEGR